MNLLDRYIALTVLKGVGIATAILLSVGTLIEFMGQLPDVGIAQYDIEDALVYVALRLPRLLFQLLPAATLIGALFSLGNLAAHRELVVMGSSGISKLRLIRSVSIAGFVLLVIMAGLGDSVAPSMSAYAREFRATALLDSDTVANGPSMWLKDGNRIVNFHREANGIGFGGVYLFEIDDNEGLVQIAHADTADIDQDNKWLLSNYAETVFQGPNGVEAYTEQCIAKDFNLSPELLDLSVVRHDLLDTDGLKRYISYLESNGLDSTQHLLAYWARMADIVSVFFMSLLALPFVFGSLRSAGPGTRLLVGLLIGLGYYVMSETFANSGQVFELDPFIVAWLPSAILLFITMLVFLRVR